MFAPWRHAQYRQWFTTALIRQSAVMAQACAPEMRCGNRSLHCLTSKVPLPALYYAADHLRLAHRSGLLRHRAYSRQRAVHAAGRSHVGRRSRAITLCLWASLCYSGKQSSHLHGAIRTHRGAGQDPPRSVSWSTAAAGVRARFLCSSGRECEWQDDPPIMRCAHDLVLQAMHTSSRAARPLLYFGMIDLFFRILIQT
jgi:hypothetical protein